MGCTGELIPPSCPGTNCSNQCHCHANQFRASQCLAKQCLAFRANQFRAKQCQTSQCLANQCPAECSPSCQDLPSEPQRLDVYAIYAPKVSTRTSKRCKDKIKHMVSVRLVPVAKPIFAIWKASELLIAQNAETVSGFGRAFVSWTHQGRTRVDRLSSEQSEKSESNFCSQALSSLLGSP